MVVEQGGERDGDCVAAIEEVVRVHVGVARIQELVDRLARRDPRLLVAVPLAPQLLQSLFRRVGVAAALDAGPDRRRQRERLLLGALGDEREGPFDGRREQRLVLRRQLVKAADLRRTGGLGERDLVGAVLEACRVFLAAERILYIH